MMTFVRAHAMRIYAVVAALLALVIHYLPDLPSDLIMGVVAALLGIGEAMQRTRSTL